MCVFYLPLKTFFPKENFQFSSRRFFRFLKLSMTCRVKVCRVIAVLYNTYVGCHRSSEAGGGGLESRYRPYFLRLFRYSFSCSYFLTAKIRVFSTKVKSFLVSGLFSQKLPLSHVTKKSFFPHFFWFEKKLSIFLKKPTEKFQS